MKRTLLYIGILILAGCVKQSDWAPPEQDGSFIVVEGVLTNETKRQSIKIHHSVNSLNADPVPVSGANVIINNEQSTFQLIEDPQDPGNYLTDSIMVAEQNTSYSLLILYMDAVYSAQGYMVPGKTFPELIYTKNSDNELYHISYVASAFESDDPAMWEVLVDWSEVAGYENEDPESCKRRLLFYTLPTLDISQIFAPLVEKVSFPAGTVIDQRRYSLNPDHASFIRTLLLETSWQGGVFPSDPANIATNLSEGALGYFGVSAVNSLSLIVTP
jgi:hypothetical protein